MAVLQEEKKENATALRMFNIILEKNEELNRKIGHLRREDSLDLTQPSVNIHCLTPKEKIVSSSFKFLPF